MIRAGQAKAATTNPAALAFLRSAAFNALPKRPKEIAPRKQNNRPIGVAPRDFSQVEAGEPWPLPQS